MTELLKKKGTVYLVGAGPGDLGLLTLRAKECLEEADVVIYDNLANPAFLEYAGEQAEKIYVGKKGGSHAMGQGDINKLIVDKASKGLRVVRLKGGDPFIFGRGGEEAQELVKAGVAFEVIPGVTSAIAVPTYAGIPLTHREYNSTVAFVTGHEDPTKERSDIAWENLATGSGTLVFLMGVGNLPKISKHLMENGRSPETPTAVIHRGTIAAQKTVVGSLKDIAERVEAEGIKPPAIIVVGDVVGLRQELNWFEERPLFGRRIVVTRAREQASGFLSGLSRLGADCIEFPSIEIIPPESWGDLDHRIQILEDYQWVLFTSVNGVIHFFERLEASGKDARALHGLQVGAIGPKTEEALRYKGITADLVPDEYRAEAFVDAMKKTGLKGSRILIPRAAQAREVLPGELKKMGAIVDVVMAYRTVKPDRDQGRIEEMMGRGQIDMVTFTSSSTVNNFVEMFEGVGETLGRWMEHVSVACIGPITAQTAEKNGLTVNVMPTKYTIDALTKAIVRYYGSDLDDGAS